MYEPKHKTVIGASQTLFSKQALTSQQVDILSAYLKGNYDQIRKEITGQSSVRSMIHEMFKERGLTSTTEFVVFRSQWNIFEPEIGTQSIISTVRESNMSDKFGSRKYAFVVAPGVPYLEIKWAIQSGEPFTEIILPLGGFFRKSTTTKYPEVDAVYRFDVKPITKSSVASASPASMRKVAAVSDINMMTLRGLEAFRALPKRKQTKRALLEILGFDDPEDIEYAESAERSAYNNALSKTQSRTPSVHRRT